MPDNILGKKFFLISNVSCPSTTWSHFLVLSLGTWEETPRCLATTFLQGGQAYGNLISLPPSRAGYCSNSMLTTSNSRRCSFPQSWHSITFFLQAQRMMKNSCHCLWCNHTKVPGMSNCSSKQDRALFRAVSTKHLMCSVALRIQSSFISAVSSAPN